VLLVALLLVVAAATAAPKFVIRDADASSDLPFDLVEVDDDVAHEDEPNIGAPSVDDAEDDMIEFDVATSDDPACTVDFRTLSLKKITIKNENSGFKTTLHITNPMPKTHTRRMARQP
jgi:hypothetical protein